MAKRKATESHSDDARAKLVDELTTKLNEVDTEGLQFLNKQADILIYNAKVDELNKKIRQTVRPKAFAGRNPDEVSIDRTKDDFFYIEVGGDRVFFNIEEMRAMTRIAHGAEDQDVGARRLHRWFTRERKDFLTDSGIASPTDQRLKRLHQIIVSTYKVKRG